MVLNKKGFTLIELMVVVVIIGVLAALAIPKFTDASAKAKMSEAPTTLAAYESAQLAHVAETGAVGDIAALSFMADSSKWFYYAEPGGTDGQFQALAKVQVGQFPSGGHLLTTVDALSTVQHTVSSGDSAAAQKYLPNFFK